MGKGVDPDQHRVPTPGKPEIEDNNANVEILWAKTMSTWDKCSSIYMVALFLLKNSNFRYPFTSQSK